MSKTSKVVRQAVVRRGRGRPPVSEGKAMMAPISVRFPEGMTAEIEAVMAARADQPDKGQVIRELVAIGLEVVRERQGRR